MSRAWFFARLVTVLGYFIVEVVLAFSDTPTSDEARHVRDGCKVVTMGTIVVNPEHPPLVKVLAALMLPSREREVAVSLAGPDPMADDARFAVAVRLVGRRLLCVRLVPILIACAGLWAFGSLFSRVSEAAAFVGVVILGGSAPFLAHGHYVTTDVAPVAFGVLAVWALLVLSWPWAPMVGGLFLGACLETKFSAPLLFPFLLAFAFCRHRWRGVAVVTVVSISLAYGVESYATRRMLPTDLRALAGTAFSGGGLGGPAPPSASLGRLCTALIGLNRAVGAYAVGLLDVLHRSATSESADLWMGRIVAGPQPLYPLATLAFKDDLPFLGLAVVGLATVGIAARWRFTRATWVAVAGGLTYFVLACRSSLHLGVRHLLPLVVLLAALATVGFLRAGKRLRRMVLWPLVAAHIVAAVAAYPHFTSARNIASRLFLPERSSYDLSDDWGQDLGRFLSGFHHPVEYLAPLLCYRDARWDGFLPNLRIGACAQCSYVLVDQAAFDALDASRGGDVPRSARVEVEQLRPWFQRVAAVREQMHELPSGEPTLRLFARPRSNDTSGRMSRRVPP